MSICKHNRKGLKLYITRNIEQDWNYCSEDSDCFYCTLVQMEYIERINELSPYNYEGKVMEQMAKISYLKRKKEKNKGFVRLIKSFSDVKIKV